MSQDDPMVHIDEDIATDDIFDAEVVKIGFCPDCGTTVIVLGDYEADVAVAHLTNPVLDQLIIDLQSIRHRMSN
jgi:hypothetical protein